MAAISRLFAASPRCALLHCGLSASIRQPVGRWNFDEHLKVESFLLFLNRLKVEE
jgi:hypothetical protein